MKKPTDVVQEQKKAIDVSIEESKRIGSDEAIFDLRLSLSKDVREALEKECIRRHGRSARQELERRITEVVEDFVARLGAHGHTYYNPRGRREIAVDVDKALESARNKLLREAFSHELEADNPLLVENECNHVWEIIDIEMLADDLAAVREHCPRCGVFRNRTTTKKEAVEK